ncbi:Mlo14p [Castilleja foliolosa]|uniref:Mlo14p n=1 Tax=Castilleja foliolosa TaxID=1961234 RepID=A0ABD3D3N9_9LAMI
MNDQGSITLIDIFVLPTFSLMNDQVSITLIDQMSKQCLMGIIFAIFMFENCLDQTHTMRTTWSVATVSTVFIVLSLGVERLILQITNWLKKTERKPLLLAIKKMKQELMLLGFIYVLITTMGSNISKICIPSKYFNGAFVQYTKEGNDKERENGGSNLNCKKTHTMRTTWSVATILTVFIVLSLAVERLILQITNNYQPFVPYEGLEQLHQLIFVMAITHICYSCMTMVFAINPKSSDNAKANRPLLERTPRILWMGT